MLVEHLHKKTTPSVCFRDEKRKSYLTNTGHVTWRWLDRWSKPLQHSSKELPSQSPEICPFHRRWSNETPPSPSAHVWPTNAKGHSLPLVSYWDFEQCWPRRRRLMHGQVLLYRLWFHIGVQGDLQTSPWGHNFPSGHFWPIFVNGGDPGKVAEGAQMTQDLSHLRKKTPPNRVLSDINDLIIMGLFPSHPAWWL